MLIAAEQGPLGRRRQLQCLVRWLGFSRYSRQISGVALARIPGRGGLYFPVQFWHPPIGGLGLPAFGICRSGKTKFAQMSERQGFSVLIESIYDAALEPARWDDVVLNLNAFVGGRACGLFSKNPISKFGVTHYYHGADPHFIQLYSDTHSQFDPLTTLPPMGKVVSIPDLVRYDEYRSGPFYQEWLKPQGCVDAANVVLDNSVPDLPILLTVLSGKRMVDSEMRRRLDLIVPHARRALAINQTIERKQAAAARFSDVLNGLSAGVFLVDSDCRILHANQSGQGLLDAQDSLRAAGGVLAISGVLGNQALRKAVAEVAAQGAVAKPCALQFSDREGQRFIAHIAPLVLVARRDDIRERKATVAIFVQRAELRVGPYDDLIARTFQLTPTELRVLLTLVKVGGVPETAKSLRIAETTIKTHLSRIFSKTGTNRQTDLVKLVAGFSNPLAH